jgi:hypothetical protein
MPYQATKSRRNLPLTADSAVTKSGSTCLSRKWRDTGEVGMQQEQQNEYAGTDKHALHFLA